jgi:hypothetical protein
MPGSPKKRERRERAQHNGEVTSPQPIAEILPDVVEDLKPKRKGRTAEEMREMTRKRMEMAKTDPTKLGGRRRKPRITEIEADAIAKLVPKAIRVLEEQLDSEDETIQARAAVKILEWGKGKPAQSLKLEGEQLHTLRYETVVMIPEHVEEIADAAEAFDEISGAEDADFEVIDE